MQGLAQKEGLALVGRLGVGADYGGLDLWTPLARRRLLPREPVESANYIGRNKAKKAPEGAFSKDEA